MGIHLRALVDVDFSVLTDLTAVYESPIFDNQS